MNETAPIRQDPSSWFQSDEACRFWQSCDRMSARRLSQGSGSVVYCSMRERGLLGWFSRRSIVQGGPMVDDPAQLEGLLEQLSAATADTIYTEIRCQGDYSALRPVFEAHCYRYRPHLNVLIDCDDEASMLSRMSKSHRRKIRIAQVMEQRGGYQTAYSTDSADFRAFYRLLRRHYWLKVRKPLPSRTWFEALLRLPSARLLVCKCQGRVIGGMVQIWYGRTVYDLYACALDRRHAAYSPSVMLYYHTMCRLAGQGGGTFDTMGAGQPGVAYGVRDFKQRFGGRTVEYGRFLHINKPALFHFGSFFFVSLRRNETKAPL